MPDILYPPSRPQSVGEVLDTAFRIFTATLVKCLPFAAVAVIAGQLPTLYDVASGRSLVQAALQRAQQIHDPVWWLLYAVAIVGTLTLTNAVLLRQYALASGRAAATGAELGAGIRKFPGVLLIGILLGLALCALIIPALVASVVLGLTHAASPSATVILVFILVAIPASWLLLRWCCSGTAFLLTDRGPVASMRHSWQLTSGSFWRLTVIFSVAVVLIIVLYVLTAVIGGVVSLLVAHGDIAVITATTAVVVVLLGALATPFYSALLLAVFGDLSVRREGTDLAQRIATPAVR